VLPYMHPNQPTYELPLCAPRRPCGWQDLVFDSRIYCTHALHRRLTSGPSGPAFTHVCLTSVLYMSVDLCLPGWPVAVVCCLCSHMPPELLRHGRISSAVDIYSFGVMMWEVFTAQPAFRHLHYGEPLHSVSLSLHPARSAPCISHARLRQNRSTPWPGLIRTILACNSANRFFAAGQFFACIVLKNMRPNVPEDMPRDYSLLMTSCWSTNPADRPSANRLLELLQVMLQERQEMNEELLYGGSFDSGAEEGCMREGLFGATGAGGGVGQGAVAVVWRPLAGDALRRDGEGSSSTGSSLHLQGG